MKWSLAQSILKMKYYLLKLIKKKVIKLPSTSASDPQHVFLVELAAQVAGNFSNHELHSQNHEAISH
jgi:hypothetical protein